jgi:hypothetical protein
VLYFLHLLRLGAVGVRFVWRAEAGYAAFTQARGLEPVFELLSAGSGTVRGLASRVLEHVAKRCTPSLLFRSAYL